MFWPPIRRSRNQPAAELAVEEPLLLTKKMILRPTAAQWRNANLLFDHPRGCRCSTCTLAAELAAMIVHHDAQKHIALPEGGRPSAIPGADTPE